MFKDSHLGVLTGKIALGGQGWFDILKIRSFTQSDSPIVMIQYCFEQSESQTCLERTQQIGLKCWR